MDASDRGLSLDGGLSLVGGPQSPLDMKPDTASLLADSFSPAPPPSSPQGGLSGGLSNGSKSGGGSNSGYPPNHPLSGSKHLCSICGDRASGKHYGVYSCEGCKGFFKRTVRKDLSYACREDKLCLVDKRQRNRCQYCRYQKCLSMGMKREAVQEERQRTKEKEQGEVESTSSFHTDMPVERILDAERRVMNLSTINYELCYLFQDSSNDIILQASDKQLVQLVSWAKHIPHFTSLPLEDQILLLRAGWNELLIAGISHRSIDSREGLVFGQGVTVFRNTAHQAGIGAIFDRVLSELVSKMRDMQMDQTELGCLRTIILYNPDVRGLKSVQEVELLREKVYASLEEYTRLTHPTEPGRFAKLLLRLPSLRSIGLKCIEHLFFSRIINAPIDNFLQQMLEATETSNNSSDPSRVVAVELFSSAHHLQPSLSPSPCTYN